jgi:hypothetical protein
MLDMRRKRGLAMGSARPKARGSRPARAVTAAVTAVVSGLLLVSCSPSPGSTAPGAPASAARPTASHPNGVISLNAISTLRSAFNRADGHTRLVLIFSPT